MATGVVKHICLNTREYDIWFSYHFILIRNRVHQDIPAPSSIKCSNSMELDTKSRENRDRAENISYKPNTSYGVVARENDENASEKLKYEAIAMQGYREV